MSPPSRGRKRTTVTTAGIVETANKISTYSCSTSTVITRRRDQNRDAQKATTTKVVKNQEKEELERVLAAAEIVLPAIKIEAFENDNDNNEKQFNNNNNNSRDIIPVNIDIKPDVNLLDQHMLLQLQAAQPATPTTTQQFVRVLVTNPNNMVLANDANTLSTTPQIVEGRRLITLAPAASVPATIVAPPTPPMVVPAALASMSEFTIVNDFEKDVFDLQTSDSDEDGYSDLDLDEDDAFFEDNDDQDTYDPVWHDQQTEKRMVVHFELPPTDIGMGGCSNIINPIFYFDYVLGNRCDFFKFLALSCNERAQKMLQANSMPQMYLQQITAEEMQIFFAICLEMCTLKLSTINDYWNSKIVTGFRGFNAYMTLNRFELLLRALNFEKFPLATHSATPTEALGDLRPLLQFFNQRMAEIHRCGERLVIKEPVIFWKGRMHWLHNISDKLRPNALILNFLNENSGLILRIVPEIERHAHKVQRLKNSRALVCQRIAVAKELLQNNLHCGRIVYASKHYCSYGLIYELARDKTYCTGFLDQKRYGNSKQLVLKKLTGNAHATKYAGSIMMGKRRRREKYIYFASSDCLAIYAQESYNRAGDTRLKIIKELDWQLNTPQHVVEAMINYQLAVERQQLKWDKTVMIYILNLLVLNAYILYTTNAQFGRSRITDMHLKDTIKQIPFAQFRQDIVQSLLQVKKPLEPDVVLDYIVGQDVQSPNSDLANSVVVSSSAKMLKYAKHVPSIIPRSGGKTIKKRCRICRKGGLLTLTKFCCVRCPLVPGLCETPCFEIWHDQLLRSQEASKNIKKQTLI